jgi:biotin transport system substrate-specific component
MRIQSYIYNDIIQLLTAPINLPKVLNRILGVTIFVILMTFGAFVKVYLPFTPVPITLQTLFALLAGAFLGRTWGASAMGVYLLIGICGLPVFAGASCGLFYLLGPTGGYIIGFICAAWIVGCMIESRSNPSWSKILFSLLLATLSIYILGITQLIFWSKSNLIQALSMGLFPFIPGAIIKIFLAAAIIKGHGKKYFSR